MDRFTKLKDKKTENEANLPDGWKRVRLGEILSFRNGKSPQIVDGGMYPIYGSNGLIGFTNDYFLNGVFLLVGRVGASGETHLVSGKVWASDNCLIGECKSDTTPVFIYYLLKYLDLKKFITQTAQPLITQSFVNNLQIILPPLPEQRKIAEILETVDNAIEKTDRIIEKYKRIKQGLMQDLLTRGIAESDELGVMSYELRDEKKHRFKDSPLGRIPEEWKVGYVSKFAEINPKTGINPTDIYPFIEMDATPIMGKWYKYLSFRKGSEAGSKFKGGDILLARITPCAENGKALLVPNDIRVGIGSTEFIVFRAKDGADNVFLFYLLVSDFVRNIAIGLMEGTSGRQRIPTYVFEEVIKVAIPESLEEQHRIASILSQIDEAIEKEQKYKEKLERIKKGLMEDLLMGKVRVNHLIEENKSLERVENV